MDGREIPELLTQEGAEGLARRLENYWAEKGFKIVTRIELIERVKGIPLHSVRSDMINGLPRGYKSGGR